MQALLNHYNVGRFSLVFLASCYASLRLTEQVFRPTVERVWRKLSSDEALDLYAYCVVFVYDFAILLGKLAIAAGKDCRRWADAFVESHLEPAATPDQPDQLDQQPAKTADAAEMEPWDEPLEPTLSKTPTSSFTPPLPALPSAKVESVVTAEATQPKRGRGRPKGSKNRKSKVLTTA